jgi:DNA-binding NarL/FixJ family response regulator
MIKVLLVEDNPTFRAAFKQNLCRDFPFLTIEEAIDAEEALQKVEGAPPDLIFSDIRLPGMNGLLLTQKVKRAFPNIPIALLTGYDLPEYREAALQSGADRFFVKEALKWEEVGELISLARQAEGSEGSPVK